jgi:hypothetical protein
MRRKRGSVLSVLLVRGTLNICAIDVDADAGIYLISN